jgi:hypothetical protein
VEEIPSHGFSQSTSLTLPPLACLILEPVGNVKRESTIE